MLKASKSVFPIATLRLTQRALRLFFSGLFLLLAVNRLSGFPSRG